MNHKKHPSDLRTQRSLRSFPSQCSQWRPQRRRGRLAGALFLLYVVASVTGCDYNITTYLERNRLQQVLGTSPCSQRIAKGTRGEQPFHVFLGDDQLKPQAIDVQGLGDVPVSMKPSDFSIFGGDDAPKVLSAEDGSLVQGVSVSLEVVQQADSLTFHPNTRYQALKESLENKRVPFAIRALIDTSEKASERDPKQTRYSAVASWMLSFYNDNSFDGDLDLFSVLLLTNGQVSSADLLFPKGQFEGSYAGKGFVMSAPEAKETIFDLLAQISPSRSSGALPMMEGIKASALDLRAIARDPSVDTPLYQPGLVNVILGQDKDTDTQRGEQSLAAAKAALSPVTSPKDSIPTMHIVYPKTSDVTLDKWDNELARLCQLTPKVEGSTWGHVFPLVASSQPGTLQQQMERALQMASFALKGHLKLRLSYTLQGAKTGERYLIMFKLQGKLLGDTTSANQSGWLFFEVRP